jgi:hypothetical protein
MQFVTDRKVHETIANIELSRMSRFECRKTLFFRQAHFKHSSVLSRHSVCATAEALAKEDHVSNPQNSLFLRARPPHCPAGL